jgi:hypothetical protein
VCSSPLTAAGAASTGARIGAGGSWTIFASGFGAGSGSGSTGHASSVAVAADGGGSIELAATCSPRDKTCSFSVNSE